MTQTWDAVRNRTAHWQQGVEHTGWPARLGVSVGLAGFLAVLATISFPVPWTPVPFSLTPLAVLIVGAYQRPVWAMLSVVLYLLAGAVGAPVYAEGSSGWHHLVGNTGGYLLGYGLVAVFASWYMQRRRRMMAMPWAMATVSLVGVLVVAGVVAIARLWGSGEGFGAYGERFAGWDQGASLLWLFAFLTVAASLLVLWALLRARGHSKEALNLYLVFLAGTAILHVCGVAGLVLVAGLPLLTALVVGSVVFLPFDIVKAGLAVAATLPFLPSGGAPSTDARSHA